TCMIYTDGWEGVDANAEPPKAMGGQFAFGAGARRNAQIRLAPRERGILLAAMTLHYRTPDELDQIRAAGCDEQPAAPPALVQPQPSPDTAAAQAQPTPAQPAASPAQPLPGQPQPEATAASSNQPLPTDAELPGEDAPF